MYITPYIHTYKQIILPPNEGTEHEKNTWKWNVGAEGAGGRRDGSKSHIYLYIYSSYIEATNWENGIFLFSLNKVLLFSIHLITFCYPYISKLFLLSKGALTERIWLKYSIQQKLTNYPAPPPPQRNLRTPFFG